MNKEVAGDPQHLDSSMGLQLQSQVRYFIQILVGLLQGGALGGHVSVRNISMFNLMMLSQQM